MLFIGLWLKIIHVTFLQQSRKADDEFSFWLKVVIHIFPVIKMKQNINLNQRFSYYSTLFFQCKL